MQTFLPYADFRQTAKVLDRARLGKQRVENLQILKALMGLSKGWVNHPATKMWSNNIWSFTVYHHDIVGEWTARGYKDTTLNSFMTILGEHFTPDMSCYGNTQPPTWLHDERVHSSHRANLLRKNAEYYGQFGWTESPQEGYWWPG